jgi:hypothetical protein
MTTRSNDNKTLLIVVIIAAALLICCCLVFAILAAGGVLSFIPFRAATNMRVETSATVERSFDVTTPVFVSAEVNVGKVTVKVGEGDAVRVSAVKRAWGSDRDEAERHLADIQIDIEQPEPNRVEIQTTMPPRLNRLGRTPTVDLEIWVPRETNLDLTNNVGRIEVTGVEGTFDLRSNVGDVTLRDVRFTDNSQIKSDVGRIDLRLPANSTFSFRAKTNVGDIDIDFDVRNERRDDEVVGGTVEGEIGDAPSVHLDLETNTGDINVRK